MGDEKDDAAEEKTIIKDPPAEETKADEVTHKADDKDLDDAEDEKAEDEAVGDAA